MKVGDFVCQNFFQGRFNEMFFKVDESALENHVLATPLNWYATPTGHLITWAVYDDAATIIERPDK